MSQHNNVQNIRVTLAQGMLGLMQIKNNSYLPGWGDTVIMKAVNPINRLVN